MDRRLDRRPGRRRWTHGSANVTGTASVDTGDAPGAARRRRGGRGASATAVVGGPQREDRPGRLWIAGFVRADGVLPYRIDFENDATATAPAQQVVITDQLSPNLDWSTFELTEVGFGDTFISVPADSQHFQTTVPMTYNGQTFEVQIEAGLDPGTGQVTAHFQSIDPATSLPPDVLTGFLPPEDGTGRGQGYFSYTVSPRPACPPAPRSATSP